MLAEGVLHYFRAQTREAYDRIRRAYGLAVALRTESALPSCAAWMAHIEFFDSKYDEMAKHLEEALTLAPPDDHQARARASLVLAMSYHLADEYQLARPWYERARLHAAAEGDEATLSAMLHDVAAYRASNVRLIDTFGGDIEKEAHRASMETSSSVNFDFAIGHQGLDFLTLMLQGLIFTINRKFDDALRIFGLIRYESVPVKMRPSINVDRAWCLVNSNRRDQAWELAEAALRDIGTITEDDEIAYAYSRLSQTATECGRLNESLEFRGLAESALERHRTFQGSLLKKLASLKTENKNPA
jgi:tetratricopeptide (TPR) repeat protein